MAQQPSLKSIWIHLHSRFCTNVSGVNKSCSNLAVPVELCRLPLKIFCWRQYLIHFHRFINFYLEKAVSRRRHSIRDYAFTMMAVFKSKLDQTLKKDETYWAEKTKSSEGGMVTNLECIKLSNRHLNQSPTPNSLITRPDFKKILWNWVWLSGYTPNYKIGNSGGAWQHFSV